MSHEEDIDEMLRTVPEPINAGAHVDDGVLIAYRDRSLADEERERIDEHLSACAHCRGLVAAYGAPVPAGLDAWAEDKIVAAAKRRSWPRRAAVGLAALAAAAAVLIVMRPGANADLPGYTLSAAAGGVATTRGAPSHTNVFVPTSKVRWLVEPNETTTGEFHLRVFVDGDDDQLVEVTRRGEIESGATGVLRFRADAAELWGARYGERTIHFVITASADPPSSDFVGSEEALRTGLPAHRWLTARATYQSSARTEGE